MRYGFVGTGEITRAVVTGLAKTALAANPVSLSPRNAGIAGELANRFAHVTIEPDNQAVLDRSDIVFLAIRPQIAESVIRELRFTEGQIVCSFVAATTLSQLAGWIGVPVRLSQAIPLPFVADLNGATAIHPRDAMIEAIFAPLGTAIGVDDKAHYDLLAAASALMATYFEILDNATHWLDANGLAYPTGRAYMAQLFSALGQTAVSHAELDFQALKLAHSTAGGLNEQVAMDFAAKGGNAALADALTRVMARITGKA